MKASNAHDNPHSLWDGDTRVARKIPVLGAPSIGQRERALPAGLREDHVQILELFDVIVGQRFLWILADGLNLLKRLLLDVGIGGEEVEAQGQQLGCGLIAINEDLKKCFCILIFGTKSLYTGWALHILRILNKTDV